MLTKKQTINLKTISAMNFEPGLKLSKAQRFSKVLADRELIASDLSRSLMDAIRTNEQKISSLKSRLSITDDELQLSGSLNLTQIQRCNAISTDHKSSKAAMDLDRDNNNYCEAPDSTVKVKQEFNEDDEVQIIGGSLITDNIVPQIFFDYIVAELINTLPSSSEDEMDEGDINNSR